MLPGTELRVETAGPGYHQESNGESGGGVLTLAISDTLDFDGESLPKSTRKAGVDGYEKACLLTFYRTKVGGARNVTYRP